MFPISTAAERYLGTSPAPRPFHTKRIAASARITAMAANQRLRVKALLPVEGCGRGANRVRRPERAPIVRGGDAGWPRMVGAIPRRSVKALKILTDAERCGGRATIARA